MALSPAELEITVERESGEHLGLVFRSEGSLELREALRGSPAERAGCGRFAGRLLTHVCGKPVAACVDVRLHETIAATQLRFAWRAGEPLDVKRSDGSYSACTVRSVSAKGYVVAGVDARGVYDKEVPIAEALRGALRPRASVDDAYAPGQPVEVRRTQGTWHPCVIGSREADKFVVMGAERGRVFEKQVPFSRAVAALRPAVDPPPAVLIQDRRTQKKLRFAPRLHNRTGGGVEYSVDGEERPVLRRMEYLPAAAPGKGGGDLRFPDIGKGAALPQDAVAILALRRLCETYACAHDIPSSISFPVPDDSAAAGESPPDRSRRQSYADPVPPERVSEDRAMLTRMEAMARRRLSDAQAAAYRHLRNTLRRAEEPYGRAASVGLRCGSKPPAVVTDVSSGSPAAIAGVQKGDLIVSVATPRGLWRVYTREQFMTALSPNAHVFAGVTVTLTVARGCAPLVQQWAAHLAGVPQIPAPKRPHHPVLPDGVAEPPAPDPACLQSLRVTCAESRSWQQQVEAILRDCRRFFAAEPGLNVELLAELHSSPVVAERLVRDAAASCGCADPLTVADFIALYSEVCRRVGIGSAGQVAGGNFEDEAGDTVGGGSVLLSFAQQGNGDPVLDAFAEAAAAGGGPYDVPSCPTERAVPVLRELVLEKVYAAQEQGLA
eukprot:TRINITY_DN55832_c0_g1_i1.p1 TRINITY_DN55832_c0_g1~~TRINITY_DN55832_c0_g1_i1.p1  ORF type:complete len:687 (+),score=185.27 TRINITY_DN55832_c0_g1_i1:68-2062(+)